MKCVVVQTAYLGDVVLTVPLLSVLRDDRLVSEVTVVASPPGSSFLREQGVVDRVITYDKRGADSGAGGSLRVVREVRDLEADAALVPHRSFRSAMMAALARIPVRVGFDASGGRPFLTEALPYRAGDHEVDRVGSLAGALGVTLSEGRLPFELRVPDGARESLSARLPADVSGRRGRVVVAPGSRWATKRWLPERFAAAAGRIARELGTDVVVVGAGYESDVCAEVARATEPPAVDLSGDLPLGQLLATVADASLVLSNDSAVTHLAAGLGAPVVAVFGPTVRAQGFTPYTDLARVVEKDVACRPCGRHGSDRCPNGTFECMRGVSADDVVTAALELLREGGGAIA